MPTPLIIAHRGNTQGHHPRAPQENTIAAFNAAIASGADMIEFDVRTTQDGIHIIHHDPEIAGAAISQTTWLALHQTNPHIPTLQQALETCRHRIALDIEIKEAGHETSIVEAILAQYSPADFVVTSFQYPVLQRIRHRLPHLMIGYLLTRNRTNWFTQPIAQIRSQLQQLNPQFLAPHYPLLNSRWLQQRNPTNLPYYPWTINASDHLIQLLQTPQIQGIITDQPIAAMAQCLPSSIDRSTSDFRGTSP